MKKKEEEIKKNDKKYRRKPKSKKNKLIAGSKVTIQPTPVSGWTESGCSSMYRRVESYIKPSKVWYVQNNLLPFQASKSS